MIDRIRSTIAELQAEMIGWRRHLHQHPELSFHETNTVRYVVERLSAARDIGIIDYHTGLGPEGYAEQIVSAMPNTDEYRRAAQWHGLAVASQSGGESVSAKLAGDWLDAAPRLLSHARATGIALEYGTVPPAQVLEALRADNWLHAHGDPLSPEGQAIKQQVRDAFYVDTEVWRGMVLGQSMIAVRQALAGLARAAA